MTYNWEDQLPFGYPPRNEGRNFPPYVEPPPRRATQPPPPPPPPAGWPKDPNWTVDRNGIVNNSQLFHELTKEVARLIRSQGSLIMSGETEAVAGLILAQLAHKHRFGPLP